MLLLVGALVMVPSAASAGGGGHGGEPCKGFADGSAVVLRDSCLEGTAHFADPGALTITNTGVFPHTYTDVDGAFDTGSLAPAERATIDVEAGVYRVYCTLHAGRDGSGMAGALIVGEPLAREPVAASSSSRVPWAPLLVLAVGLAALGAQRVSATRSASASTS